MSLSIFLQALLDHGRVHVAAPTAPLSKQDMLAAMEILREQDSVSRLDAPEGLPELELGVALWGAKTAYGACQLVVFRQLDEPAIAELLPPAPTHGNPQSRHWSADLTLRFLPDLLRQASAVSEEDPLVRQLRSLAYQWPLSSVGIEGVNPEHVDELAASPALLQLYVDRILARKDFPRLRHPLVREAARISVGIHAELWPDLTKYLQQHLAEPALQTP